MKATRNHAEPLEPTWDTADPMASFRRYGDHLHQKAKHLFLEHGRHIEIMIFFHGDGKSISIPIGGDRDRFVSVVKHALNGSGVIGIVHICEAWTHISHQPDHVNKQLLLGEMAVSDLRPEDRGEALFTSIQGCDGQSTCWVDPILRDKTGKISLGKGFQISKIGGRFGKLFQ